METDKNAWASSTETFRDELEDVCLNEDAKTNPTALPTGTRPDVLNSTLHEYLFVAVIAFAAASSVFMQRSVVVIAADIGNDLNLSPAEIAWVSGASGLTTGAFLIPFGHLADICPVLSRKYILLLSLAAFSLIVAFASFSPNGIVVDLMSGLAGIACAATIPVSVGILSLAYPIPSRRKNIVFSSFLMGNPAATIIGGLSSGALASSFNWKATFIFLGILYALITFLGWLVVPNVTESTPHFKAHEVHHFSVAKSFIPVSNESSSIAAAVLQFDWIGLILLVTGVLMFTVALTIGPEGTQPWKTPTVILLLTLGLLFLGCFILWEGSTSTPMIPTEIWDNWNVIMINLSTLSCSMAYYSAIFWISMFLQKVENLEPFDVAVRLLPQALMGLLISPLVGLIMHTVPGTYILVVAGFCSVASNIPLIFLEKGSNYFALILPSLILSTIGMDWTINVGSLYILSTLPLKHHSIGASLLQTTTRLGFPFGLAVTTAVWSSYSDSGYDINVAYSKAFVTTAAFASFSLALAPLIRIGRQGRNRSKPSKEEAFDHRPSKRWSRVETLSSKSTMSNPKPGTIRLSSNPSEAQRTEKEKQIPHKRGLQDFANQRTVWVVCEQCNASRRVTDPPVGDPAKYFNNITLGFPEKPNHDMIMNGRRKFPLVVKNETINR
ncbi:major facilitator superfamily domain-containing protein [Xylariales sp. AK1849]|nr:major facilitator superfamily domain-containing protein [Xylariales sp. AK1849]